MGGVDPAHGHRRVEVEVWRRSQGYVPLSVVAAAALERDHVDPEVVDRPVLEAASELAAVGLVERRFERDPEATVALVVDRAGEVGVHLEPAGEQEGLHHLRERLPPLRPLGTGGDHHVDGRAGLDRLVRRQGRLSQGDRPEHADGQAHGAERETPR